MQDDSAEKFEVIQTLNAYMHAVDAADVDVLRNRVFSSDAEITLLEPLGVEGYCAFVKAIMQDIRTQHFLLNSLVEVSGDNATSRSYFVGFQRVPSGKVSDACTAIFGICDEDSDVVTAGVYNDCLVRDAAGWRISERKITLVWDNRAGAGNTLAPDWLRSTLPIFRVAG